MKSARLRQFARENWVLLTVFAGSLAVAGWFLFHFVANFLFFHDPRNQDGDLRPWMNPHFIVMMYELPRPIVLEILELPEDERGGRRLGEIAAELDLTMEQLTDRVRAEAATFREAQP